MPTVKMGVLNSIISISGLEMVYESKIRRSLFGKPDIRRVHALRGINLEIPEGKIFGILGPNGAGKSTLIKCLTTLLIPTSGDLFVNGYNVLTEDKDVRASIGCMLMGERGLYWKLTGRENLEFFGKLYALPREFLDRRIPELLQLLDLEEFADRTVEGYSSGQRMKFAFAKALLNDAPVIFLDEPTVAMDVHGARKLRSIVKDLPKAGKTVVYTSHIMSEISELCDEVAIIDYGKIIALDTPRNLVKSSKLERSLVVTGIISENVVDKLRSLPNVQGIGVSSNEFTEVHIQFEGENPLTEVTQVLVQSGSTIRSIELVEPTLEDVFIDLTGRSLSEDSEVRP